MRKVLIICILAISITLMVNVKAYAEEEPSATPTLTAMPNPYSKLIVRADGSVNLNNVYDSYFNLLTNDQQDLCNYLIGLSNYMYLTARGFKYETVSTGEQLISMLCAFGYRFWQVVPDEFSSRLTNYMQNYIAACVTYAAQQDDINGNLGAWIDSHADDLYIPYSDNELAGWTAFYNDPSNLGVSNWGSYETDWVSGEFYDYSFSGYEFYNSSVEERYNSFLLNDSPVLYSNIVYFDNEPYQAVFSLKDINVPNSLYILRSGNNSFTSFRFLYNDVISSNVSVTYRYYSLKSNNKVADGGYSPNYAILSSNIINTSGKSLTDIISYAFYITPFNNIGIFDVYWNNFYPYVSHVYLVDDLNTLSNKEEITSEFSFFINDDNAKWIQTPKGEVLYYPIGSGAILKEFPLPENLKKDDGQGNLVTIDPTTDLQKDIVNNTVINNYQIVTQGVQINVPVDWFKSEGNYLDYTYNYSLPFFAFVGDMFLALGEIRIFLLAGVILLICGGVIGKFLL